MGPLRIGGRGLADLAGWLSTLSAVYGGKYLLAVIFYNHILKGFVLMYAYTSLDFVLRAYHVRGPKMQVLKSAALLPWVSKPILGVLSDVFPICGYRKNPYIIGVTLVGVASFAVIGFYGEELTLEMAVAAFFGMSVQISSCDLMADAATAEKLRREPAHGPAMMAFVSAGTTVADIVATATVGSVLERLGPRGPALVCVFPSALMLVPAAMNWLGDRPQQITETAAVRANFSTQKEVLVLVLVLGVGSCALLAVSTAHVALFTKLLLVGALAVGIGGAFVGFLNPTLGLMNAFFFLQSMSAISVEGGSFYFFTDDPTSFPLGPHFSVWFYTTGLGLAGNVCGLVGLWIYSRHMTTWRYHSIFMLSNTLWCVVSAANTLVFTRGNRQLGIPDHVFVLGGTVLQNVFERWTYVPGGVLLSQVCPPGMEATMFALLAGCHNLGRSVASYLGAFLLTYLQIRPSGMPHEEVQFQFLWKAAMCQAVAPLLTLWLLPRMIPNARQTERIIDYHEEAANSGSPWSRLRSAWDSGKQHPCEGGTGYGAASSSPEEGDGATGSSIGLGANSA